jgi:RNA polymerase sigma factor for flagellar operon FliA
MSRSARNRLVIDNLPLVGYLANAYGDRSGLVAREDLASAGAMALIMAADTFDPERGVPFGAYARRRILGAFTDEMRARDWASRTIRTRAKGTTAVRDALSMSLGRTPTTEEIAMTLGVDTQTVVESLADASRVITSFDDDVTVQAVRSDELLPEEILEQNENARMVNLAVSALPERTRFIIQAVYFEERTVRSVADELGVSHSAISQKRAQGVRLLRETLIHHFGKVSPASSALA